jgi:hypothetical protein
MGAGLTAYCPDCGTRLHPDDDGGWCPACARHISWQRIATDPWEDQ